jgi:poly(3-hydroxybutyrate) depolymerase
MPASFMTLFPQVLNALEAGKIPLQTSANLSEAAIQSCHMGFENLRDTYRLTYGLMKNFMPFVLPHLNKPGNKLVDMCSAGTDNFLSLTQQSMLYALRSFQKKRKANLEFIKLFTEAPPEQSWNVEYDDTNIILDLPSIRLIDISLDTRHKIRNYGVVFAPRAGHHSNIAERVALYMRDQGITRMAIAEQKCGDEIPLYVNGKRHYENFDGQVKQYKSILEHLKGLTGSPPHLVGICQPGPLLMATLLLNPKLAKTFGSAGSPMDTEGEKGFLSDFARMAGETYIDTMIRFFGHTVAEGKKGAGRECYDGRLQVLAFYAMGMDQHIKNLDTFMADLQEGNKTRVERQKAFYQWYNYAHHSPVGFIRDTFNKIFIRNELIRGELVIGEKKVGIKDYPADVPIWALGGSRDDVTPPLQAIGHLHHIDSLHKDDKLSLISDGGHMGLFRSRKILKEYYTKIVDFILNNSDFE